MSPMPKPQLDTAEPDFTSAPQSAGVALPVAHPASGEPYEGSAHTSPARDLQAELVARMAGILDENRAQGSVAAAQADKFPVPVRLVIIFGVSTALWIAIVQGVLTIKSLFG